LFASEDRCPRRGPQPRSLSTGPISAAPIEIADPTILRPFNVWAGPGTMSCIRGVCTEAPRIHHRLGGWRRCRATDWPQRYTLSFYSEQQGQGNEAAGAPVEEPS
jgi:hypothetical protein